MINLLNIINELLFF